MLKRVFEQLPPGSFTYEDAEVIVRSLNRIESIKGDCLEIGSDLGRSSTLIAEIIKENSHLFCVDIWSNETWNELASQLGEKAATYPRRDPKAFEIFRHNIKKRGLNAVVTPIRNKSEEAIKEFKNPLKFIFIDGCHEYEYVKKDIEWVKYLVEGGEVVFHDYTDSWPDVKAAVNEFASNHSFKPVDSGGNCICFRKRIREHSVSSSSDQPLVSVIIPTHNRAELLTTRAIPSILSQTYQNFEIIIVADRCTDDTKDRVQKIEDPRIRFVDFIDRPPLPDDLHARWRVASAAPRNKGLEMAKGEWITLLDDDDEFAPNHIEILLKRALMGYDFVYGNLLAIKPNGEQTIIGKYPPEHAHIGASSFIYSSKYKNIKFNTDAAATREPGDWNFCRRVIEAGAKISYINEVVYIHHMPIRDWERQKEMLEWTGERFLPWIEGTQIHYEHLHRYAFVAHFVKDKKVLDLACGEGYGTYILAREAKYVAGVEIDRATVEHARSRYIKDNLEFIEGSILAVPIEGEKKFDVVVCFEAIEHIAEHDKLLSEVKRLLKDDGLFIVSTPNKTVYTDEPDYHNPFHIKELDFDEFKNLLRQYFAHMRIFGQRVYAGSNMWSIHQQKSRGYIEEVVKKGDMEFYFAERASKEPVYFIALASNASLKPLTSITDSWLTDVSNAFFNDYERRLAELNQTRLSQISSLETSLQEKVSQIDSMEYQIQQIQQSIPMQLVNRYQRVIEKLLRPGTRRRYYYELGLTGIRVILNEGWRSFFRKAWNRLAHRPAAIKKPRHDLPKFNNSISEKEADKLVLPAPSEKPEVSIIIPVCNNWRHTLNCLKSIAENTDGDYEVVVIDDASSDVTAEVLSKVTNLYAVTNKQNEGFIESCNRGARASTGKYILFLNNDTLVTKGWLPPLLELIKREDVGAVGSKLVYPDGTLQEAGSIVWRDGSALGYGRGDDSSKPEYNYVRDVDYCSGASLMVKRELFEKTGGLDDRFKPSYYEDADLCFTIKNLGYRVMYQPASEIVHLEGATCGTDVHTGIKQYQEINKPKFVKKWKNILDKHECYEGYKNILSSRNRLAGKSILIMDDRIPDPAQGSGYPRAHRLLKFVSELGYRVTFFPLADATPWQPYTNDLQQLGIELFYGGNLNLSQFAKDRADFYELVLVSRPHNMKRTFDIIRRFFPRAALLYDAEAIFSVREILKSRVRGDERMERVAEGMMSQELNLVKKADLIITVSENERKVITEKTGVHNVRVWGHPVPVKEPRTLFSQRKDILFVGGFPGPDSPNEAAILYFAKEIFPKVESELGCRLFILGMNPPDSVRKLSSPSVIVPGYVEDLREYYEKCRLFVVPHRYSAGIPLKLLEAMGYGIPSVVSKLTAAQLDLTDGKEVLVADTSEEFAKKVIKLYQDDKLWHTVQNHALNLVRETCAPENMKDVLNEIILQGLQTKGGE
ncbi:MAG TPA: glycosyltransferase [Dehalococcoidia bacterium]|nr:glycosyltransferase [Dehalococcoidia bacterium]